MNNHDDDVNETAIEQFIAAAIQKGTFVPTASWRQAHTHPLQPDPLQPDSLRPDTLAAAQSPNNQPESPHNVSFLAPHSVKIPNQTPLETYRYFCSQGYRCVKAFTADGTLTIPASKEGYSWDQQLILSIWHCLEILECSSESPPKGGASSSALQSLRLEWFKTTAQLSSQKRLEQFSRDFIISRLRKAPIAIFIDSLEPCQDIPHGIEALFAWIWQCSRQLEQQTDCHPLRFVVLGQIVA